MFTSLIDWILNYPKRFIFFILLITLAASCFVYKNISINTSNTDLLSKELTFRKNDIAFTKEFPQFSNNIMVVIDAKKSDIAKDIASSFYKEIKKKEGELFNDIFYPEELDFFKKNGFMYLSEEEIEEKLDQMTSYQPFISRLSKDQTLYGLLNTINFFLSADLNDSYIEKINKLLTKLNERGSLTWGDIFSNNKKSNYREIIHLQPILNFSNFFPSKDSLAFLEKKIKNIKDQYQHINYRDFSNNFNFNIRLTGPVPMEQDELNTLGGGAKIGVIISLILVSILLLYAFKNKYLFLGSVLTLIIGLIWTTAFALLFFKELNLISIAFAILFIGLGIDFSIHYGLRTYEFLRHSMINTYSTKDKETEIITNTSRSITKALFLTAMAIAIGFFSFAFTSFKGLAQLGVIAGTGMFISLFLTLLFLPSFLILKKGELHTDTYFTTTKKSDFQFTHFMFFFNRNSIIFFSLSLVFFCFSILNLKNIQFNNDPLKLRNQTSTSVETMNELIKDKDINPHSVDILVKNFSMGNELKSKISNLKEVKKVTSFRDLIPENQEKKIEILNQFKIFFPEIDLKEPKVLNQDFFDDEKRKINESLVSIEDKIYSKYKDKIDIENIKKLKDKINSHKNVDTFINLEKQYFYFFKKSIKKFTESLKVKRILENDIPDSLKARYVGKSGEIRLGIVPFKNLNDQANKKRFIESVYEVAPNVSGGAFTTYEAGKTIIQSFKEAMIISICLTTLFLFFALRNFKKVFIVFINLVAALLFSLSFLTLSGLNLNFANIIALPLLFGLGAATSIQTILRTEKFKTLDDYFANSTTPRAIIFSLLTTLGTFFVLTLSSHVGTASMGKLLIISLFSIFLANLTILIPLEKYFFKK